MLSKSCFHQLVLFFFCALIAGNLFAADDQMEASAKTAQEWLKYIDNGDYGQSWEQTALRTKLTMQKAEWNQLLGSMRKPLGRLNSRTIAEQRPAPNPKGLPPGEYMMIVYKSSFDNKPSALELVTLVLGEDKKWHVLTYLVN